MDPLRSDKRPAEALSGTERDARIEQLLLAGIDEDDVLLPTSAYAHITFDTDTWDNARKGTGRWEGIMTPDDLPEDEEEA